MTSSLRMQKPIKSSSELVCMMREEKGITFNTMTDSEAATFLCEKNNYFRTASYRKNYKKYSSGEKDGQYMNLDFEYLKQLSAIDTALRGQLLKMCIDVEHALKVKLLTELERMENIDPYVLVDSFLTSNPSVIKGIEGQYGKFFTGSLVEKYFKHRQDPNNKRRIKVTGYDCPMWVFLELLSLGNFLLLYQYVIDYYDTDLPYFPKGVVNPVKDLRNACAHNNCLLTDLHPQKDTRPSREVVEFISANTGIGADSRKKKLHSRPILDFSCLLYMMNQVLSPEALASCKAELYDIIKNEMLPYGSYYRKNDLLMSSYRYFKLCVDFYL